jgi:hypothetical protein
MKASGNGRFEIRFDTYFQMLNILNKYTHAYKKDINKTFKTKTYDLSDYEEIKTNLMKYAMIEEKDMNREISFTPDEDGKHVLVSFPFDRQVVNILKELPKEKREYNSDKRQWKIESTALDCVKEKIEKLKSFKFV